MGDRRKVEIVAQSMKTPIVFYTHWSGAELPKYAEEALMLNDGHRGDDTYAAMAIVDTLHEKCGRSSCGLSTNPDDFEDEYNRNDQTSMDIDLDDWKVNIYPIERPGG